MNLKGKSLAELRDIAKKLGVNVAGKTPADLIRLIEKAEKAKRGKGTAAHPAKKAAPKKTSKPKDDEDEEEEEDDEEEEAEDEEEEEEAPKKKGKSKKEEEDEDEDSDEEDEDEESDDEEEEEADGDDLKVTPASLAKMKKADLTALIKKIHADKDILKKAKKDRIPTDGSPSELREAIMAFLEKYAEEEEEDEEEDAEEDEEESDEEESEDEAEDEEEEEEEAPKKGKKAPATKGAGKPKTIEDRMEVLEAQYRELELRIKVLEKVPDDDEGDGESALPEWARVGAKVEVDFGDEGWQRATVKSINEKKKTVEVTLEDAEEGEEEADADWSDVRAADVRPKRRKK